MANNRAFGSVLIPERSRKHYPPIPNRSFLERPPIKPYSFHTPKPSDWRKDVTVCIAAICDGGKGLIVVADERITLEETSANTLTKFDFIANGDWVAMFAGDVSQATALTYRITAMTEECTLDGLVNASRAAYSEMVAQYAGAKILGALNLTMTEFLQKGKDIFPESVFDRLIREIQTQQTTKEPCVMLVCGFDESKEGHIFSIHSPSDIQYVDLIGFGAIGTGAFPAIADLHFHGYSKELSSNAAIYRVLSAKFMSERALAVGETTNAVLLYPNQAPLDLDSEVNEIRKIWEEEGRARLPENYEERMGEIIKTIKTSSSSPSEQEPPS